MQRNKSKGLLGRTVLEVIILEAAGVLKHCNHAGSIKTLSAGQQNHQILNDNRRPRQASNCNCTRGSAHRSKSIYSYYTVGSVLLTTSQFNNLPQCRAKKCILPASRQRRTWESLYCTKFPEAEEISVLLVLMQNEASLKHTQKSVRLPYSFNWLRSGPG